MDGQQGFTPRHNESYAQTLGSNDELRFPSWHAAGANGQMLDTPTDESTIPHGRTQPQSTPTHNSVEPQTHESQQPKQTQNQQPRKTHLYQSTPIYASEDFSNIHDNQALINHLQHTISMLDMQMDVIQDHAKEEIRKLHDRYKQKEEELEIAIDMMNNQREAINKEKADLSKQLANTRVELKTTKDKLTAAESRFSGSTEELNKKLKALKDEQTRDKSQLSGLNVRFNDQKKIISEQKAKIEEMETQNRKLRETNAKIMSTITQLRLQNQGLQQSLNTANVGVDLNFPTARQTPSTARQLNRNSAQNLSNASLNEQQTTRQSRPTSSLRFSNRTQVRDITPPNFSSMIEQQERPSSPQGVESEIHTASCRHNCHLFEHEGDDGRFRWVCGINEQIVVLYREQRYVVFVGTLAEIQFFGEGENRGQMIIFWGRDEANREITVYRTNGTREEYRLDRDGNILYREVFNPDGSAFRITDAETVEIENETPLVCGARAIQQGADDFQIHHQAFGLRIVNHEFLRIQITRERLQVTMCLCENRRVFNVKHCSDGFQQKTLCTFVGQCPNMQRMISNLNNEIYIKRDGDCSGQPVAIENCEGSFIAILDNLASITIDDCKKCLIILGPCQGSVFIRDCFECVIYTACQQFRSRDCLMSVGLFCSTAPIIEETNAKIYPLTINYPHMEDQMKRAELFSKPNLYKDVQDFTPDISQLQIYNEKPSFEFKSMLVNIDVDSVFNKEGITL